METDGASDGGANQPPVETMDTQEHDTDEDSVMLPPEKVSAAVPPPAPAQITIEPSKVGFYSTATKTTTAAALDTKKTEDKEMQEELRSEATFRFLVENFSQLKDAVLSPPCYVRKLPWKILVIPKALKKNDSNHIEKRSFGFFLQCNAENDSSSWSCNAKAELRLNSFKPDQEAFERKIIHQFCSKRNDYGFSNFQPSAEILNPENEYIQNDAIELEVHVNAEAPHGLFWNSKKHTGFVGLKNQGATCYMNSLLQTLFFTNNLRKAVYKIPTEADDSRISVALALQRVFHDLQFTDQAVGTKKLTQSFGWGALDTLMQHDVQEFLRILLDKLESKMKGTSVEGTIPDLFGGTMSSYINCKNVSYTSTRLETFYDIQLNIKGKKNITESFRDYVDTETLEGNNKYEAGENGFQEAEKGVIFVSFPPILHLHLMRFEYEPLTENSVKFNDRFEFHEQINLDEFLQERVENDPADYTLHAVLVHSGNINGGHYVVYINPLGDGRWYKFDDDVVSNCTKSEAIDSNYGGADDAASSNAYMLVYIRNSAMSTVLQEIPESEIPTELTERLLEEHRMAQIRHHERNEAHMYMAVNILLEEYLEGSQSTNLLDSVQHRVFQMKKRQTVLELMEVLQVAFRMPADRMRLWPQNKVLRPILLDNKDDLEKSLIDCAESQNPWTIFLEMLPPDSILTQMPKFVIDLDVLLFFKYYDPASKRLNYCGSGYYNSTQNLSGLLADMNQRAGLKADTELTVYEVKGENIVQRVHIDMLVSILSNLDFCILIFEDKTRGDEHFELATCEDYLRDLIHRVEVTFLDKTNPSDPGFVLELSQRLTYDQMASTVGKRTNLHPYEIQFFKCAHRYKDVAGQPIRSSSDGSLKDWLVYNAPKPTKKIFYQQLSMNITELESKKLFRCTWLSINMKEEKELTLYSNPSGSVKNLLEEAAKQIDFNCEQGSGQLRIVKIYKFKILPGPREEDSLEYLQDSLISNVIYRIEEIPKDETNLADDEMLVPVLHFYKHVCSLFGNPFYVKLKQGEPLSALKERIRKKCGVSNKEWEKYKFAIVSRERVEYLTDVDLPINLFDFRPASNIPLSIRIYLGLEHMNKTQRSSLEAAIKIYN